MKITEVKTYLTGRGWIFVKILTDEGIHGVGEGGGWPRVVATAVEDLAPVLIGEDPFHIEKLWHKLFVSRSGVAMTGMVAGGALSALEMALWDIKGKALGLPVWNLLGGKMHDRLRVYTHADSVEDAEDRGEARLRRAQGRRHPACREARPGHSRRLGPRRRPDGRSPRRPVDDHARCDRDRACPRRVRNPLLRGTGVA